MIDIAGRARERIGASYALTLSRLGAWVASTVGLGIAIAATSGDARVVRWVGVVAGGLAIALLARLGVERVTFPALGAAVLVSGVAATGDALARGPAGAAVFGALLLAFMALGFPVARSLLASAGAVPASGVALASPGELPVLDLEAVATELNRARRYHRPLSVLSIDLSRLGGSYVSRRGPAAELASSLSACLRQSDLLGYRSRARLLVVLPETRAEDLARLVGRMHTSLDPKISAALGIGASSFPDEELTWVGLEGLAVDREIGIDEWLANRPGAGGTRVLSVVDDLSRTARLS